jgi:hypothetical protein
VQPPVCDLVDRRLSHVSCRMSKAERQIGESERAIPAAAELEDHSVRPVWCRDLDLHASFQLGAARSFRVAGS